MHDTLFRAIVLEVVCDLIHFLQLESCWSYHPRQNPLWDFKAKQIKEKKIWFKLFWLRGDSPAFITALAYELASWMWELFQT